jgi:hypothetical protein
MDVFAADRSGTAVRIEPDRIQTPDWSGFAFFLEKSPNRPVAVWIGRPSSNFALGSPLALFVIFS